MPGAGIARGVSGVIHQATAVAIGGRALLIEGAPGSGKSALALALIDRGATLIGDDGVTLAHKSGQLWAFPPPNISGKLEIRNVGLIDLPTTEAPVALVLRLDPCAPRHVETADAIALCGACVPMLRLYPDAGALPLRAEWALRLHCPPDIPD
ncbi:HPr kinase/phosphorylase [Altericroceibacterium xinjiangense]|uniref:HPr kinase/phosphorylase n=1 Tax=Altericroceibacterium xinjiangense TaxID=762261 RepID=UPI000F7E979E|nr:HPr kinase/phosphatase C-terminal domain-containing protein [Altericroceibacterium xinjiangense]